MRKINPIAFPVLFFWPFLAAACPNLSGYYPDDPSEALAWQQARTRLAGISEQCLRDSEYFALLGAAQFNSGDLSEAMESLERALLLDPDNGAALIDYAEALLQSGQLFAALEINRTLLERKDLPPSLKPQINQRQRDWKALTRQTNWLVEMSGGYDNNLNGAPDAQAVTLTLSGEPIFLTLNEQFRAVSGPFLNARILGQHQRLAPGLQHIFLGQMRGRHSRDANSDVVQIIGRYSRLESNGRKSWQWGAGVNHLLFAGQSLFTGTDASARLQLGYVKRCRTYLSGALQHQAWHQQRLLDGLEVKASLGGICHLRGDSSHRVNIEGSLIHNAGFDDNRLGENRNGWQFSLTWQKDVARGQLQAQLNHTQISDQDGYSPLLKNNARRKINRNSVLLQYREKLNWSIPDTNVVVNIYHQDQQSNLGLFETQDTSIEIGLSLAF